MKKIAIVLFVVSAALAGCGKKKAPESPASGGGATAGSAMGSDMGSGSAAGGGEGGGSAAGSGGM